MRPIFWHVCCGDSPDGWWLLFLLQTVSVSTFRYVVELRYRATMFGLNKRPDMSVLILLLNEFALNSTSAAVSDTFAI